MSDRLTFAHAIEDAGMERAKAERVAGAIGEDLIHHDVATNTDLASVTSAIAHFAVRLETQ